MNLEKAFIKIRNNRKNITELYKTRDQYLDEFKNKPIRLHSSTIDSKSAFACFSAICKNQITIGRL